MPLQIPGELKLSLTEPSFAVWIVRKVQSVKLGLETCIMIIQSPTRLELSMTIPSLGVRDMHSNLKMKMLEVSTFSYEMKLKNVRTPTNCNSFKCFGLMANRFSTTKKAEWWTTTNCKSLKYFGLMTSNCSATRNIEYGYLSYRKKMEKEKERKREGSNILWKMIKDCETINKVWSPFIDSYSC